MTDERASWLEWQGSLDDSEVPPRTAVWVARHGNVNDRHILAADDRLPADAVLILAEDADPMVIEFLATNTSVSADILAKLVTTGKASAELVQHNLNAPLEYKLAAPFEALGPSSISMFLDAVRADDAERAQLWMALDSPTNRKRTLGDLWSVIRPM